MTVKATFPDKKPKLYVDFTSGKPDIRFGSFRETVGSYIGKDGFIKIGNYKTPRIDHDPLTGECLGLLMENGTTNLISDHREWNNNCIWGQYFSNKFNSRCKFIFKRSNGKKFN